MDAILPWDTQGYERLWALGGLGGADSRQQETAEVHSTLWALKTKHSGSYTYFTGKLKLVSMIISHIHIQPIQPARSHTQNDGHKHQTRALIFGQLFVCLANTQEYLCVVCWLHIYYSANNYVWRGAGWGSRGMIAIAMYELSAIGRGRRWAGSHRQVPSPSPASAAPRYPRPRRRRRSRRRRSRRRRRRIHCRRRHRHHLG